MMPMHYGTFPLGNEHPDEPIQRLLAEAKKRGLEGRVIVSKAGKGVEI